MALVGIRMMMDYYPMNLLFTQKDLYWLDQLMPGKKKTDMNTGTDSSKLGSLCGLRKRGRKNDTYEINGKADVANNTGENYEKNKLESDDRATFCQSMLSSPNNTDKAASTLEPLLDKGANDK